MYPGNGTYIPINQNGWQRSAKEQVTLDQDLEQWVAWKKETQLDQYQAAFERFLLQQDGIFEEDELDEFILAFPNMHTIRTEKCESFSNV